MLIKKEVKEIYYGTGVDVWDTQGPAPDGYHVPTNTEWQAVYDMGVALGQWSSSNGDGMRIKLKMPFAGQRDYSSSNVNNQGSNANYWASTVYSISFSYRLRFNSDGLSPQSNSRCSNGFSLRCFKNSPLIPNSSWTTIYEGTGGAGIYHNASEGVISISSDGTNWITIADKNLGATQVYNDGDTLSEANCGKYYQRGNNYGFPRTGTISKKSLKTVNASAYGPLNYYNSDTWITVNQWDSSNNKNLRGGVSQGVNPGVKNIKSVYLGTSSGFKKIRPAGWTPGANTLAYFPLTNNQNDVLGNYTLPLTGTKEQIGFTFSKSGNQDITINQSQRFCSCWVKFNSSLASGAQILGACNGGPFYNYYNSYSDANKRFQVYSGSSRVFNSDPIQTDANARYHYAVGWDGTKAICYINGTKVAEGNCNNDISTTAKFIMNINVTFSDLIYESSVRTQQKITDYYNNTKSNYGL